MTTRFVVETSEGQLAFGRVTAGMSVFVTVPPWKDHVCLDILVEAQGEEAGEEALVFSSQWMDFPLSALRRDTPALLDGLHVTWPEKSVNDPLQPPASVYDGRHGMVTEMDLRLVHIIGGRYHLSVKGAAEFISDFTIEVPVTLNRITAANDDRTCDADVAAWFKDRFTATGLTGSWQVQHTAHRDVHSFVASVALETDALTPNNMEKK